MRSIIRRYEIKASLDELNSGSTHKYVIVTLYDRMHSEKIESVRAVRGDQDLLIICRAAVQAVDDWDFPWRYFHDRKVLREYKYWQGIK